VLGEGLQLSELKLLVKSMSLNNVHFIPPVSMDEVGSFLNCADVLLVHLNSDPLFEITIPSKTQAYMAAGKPLIMGVRGDAANLISMADCGVCIEPENAVSLAEAAKHLMLLSSDDIQKLGKNAACFYDDKLSVKAGVDAFAEIFEKVLDCNVSNGVQR
jgi:colanic acid biosynthesis glycosyl transferase WcaI